MTKTTKHACIPSQKQQLSLKKSLVCQQQYAKK